MIKSMTGYGRSGELVEGKMFVVEIKGVNHRYFDFNPRTPRGYSFLEEKAKAIVSDKVSRGKIDLFISIQGEDKSDTIVKLNKSVVESYLAAINELKNDYDLKDDVTVMNIFRLSEVFCVEKKDEDMELISEGVAKVLEQAVQEFVVMRENEGKNLASDLKMRLSLLLDYIRFIEQKAPEMEIDYQNRLTQKMEEILSGLEVDNARILTEVAIFADKVSLTEELVRLRSHICEFEKLLNESAPVGRKLDFLIQEMNREVNTIGSKCNLIHITQKVVDLKSELEKIREQVQNIE